ncbi:MAG: hypothetical protein ABSE90_04020 [Verrucomicrobiota bacterium]|jgi:hypothetical protein
MNDKPKTFLPRDRGGSFSVPSDTGAIKRLVGLDGFMEIYTVHATYRVKSPDNLDPTRTVPNMPWSQSAHAMVGASNPIVARIFIQAVDALDNWPLRNGNIEAIKRHLHVCKEEAIICETAYNKLKLEYDKAVARVNDRKLKIQGNMVECPHLPSLRDEATAFLTSAKRAIQGAGEVFNQFYVPDGTKPLVKNANFSFAITRIENSRPGDQVFLDFLKKIEPVTKRFVEMRNGLEHPTGKDFTKIEDFQLTPKGIASPTWQRNGFVEDGPILVEMEFFMRFIIDLCENIFFFGLMDNIGPNLPIGFQVQELAEEQIDAECPIRYRLTPKFA